MGSALHTFEVPPTSGFRVSTPVVTDTLEVDGSPRIELEPVFASSSTLHCRYEVFGALADKATGTARVTGSLALESGDRTVMEGRSSGLVSDGQRGIPGAYDLPLSTFAPGSYTLALHVTDELAAENRTERTTFTVVAR